MQMSWAGAGILRERVRKADVARAESADRTWRELRMGPLAGPCYVGPGEGFVFIWRLLQRQRKDEQHRVPAEEYAFVSVTWNFWSGCESWFGGGVGAAARLKGVSGK